jgi:hypothetical protein
LASVLEDQVFHLGDGGDVVRVLDAQGRRQIGVGVGVDGQYVFARIVERTDEQGGESGFTDTAFAADRNFHSWGSFQNPKSVISFGQVED